MNSHSPSHNFEQASWVTDAFAYARNMLPMGVTTMSASPSSDVRNVSDDRINPQETRRGSAMMGEEVQYETTIDGDVVVVQPSFDDSIDRSKTPTSPTCKTAQEWQARSPKDDAKMEDKEPRNPSSPPNRSDRRASRHTRNLSTHFFDATSLNDKETVPSSIETPEFSDDAMAGRKHRRMFSGGASNPPLAHRRINSVGNSAVVKRHQQQQHHQQSHQREDSAGLEILSAAVASSSKEELAQAVGAPAPVPWEPPRPSQAAQQPVPPPPKSLASASRPRESIGHVSTASYEPKAFVTPTVAPTAVSSSMEPPPYRHPGACRGSAFSRQHPPTFMTCPPPHWDYPPSSFYPPGYLPSRGGGPPHPPQHPPPPPPRQRFPVQYSQRSPGIYPSNKSSSLPSQSPTESSSRHGPPEERIESEEKLFNVRDDSPPAPPSSSGTSSAGGTHQGVQTFVTAISVGPGHRTMHASSALKNVSTNTDETHSSSVPSQVGHHRKMSSFSSLGTMLGSSILSPVGHDSTCGSRVNSSEASSLNHRPTSSTVSFLQGLDVALESTDDSFLRNLQASNSGPAVPSETTSTVPTPRSSPPPPRSDSPAYGTKLAAGGTSKRVRRKCTVEGCPNRVVQGGLCISHGAKRKTCKHPGCNKNVKKAGLCSTHGPARKRCEADGCQKVAVQGGRCIAHGAKKKLCSVEDCTKQAILSGMCKKHHDQANAPTAPASSQGGPLDTPFCQQTNKPAKATSSSTQQRSHKVHHTRGLSIFQEISADGLKSLLGDAPDVEPVDASAANREGQGNNKTSGSLY